MIFWINVLVFVICLLIQFFALNRRAFGRAIFITISMFFFTGLVYIAPDAPRFLVWLLLILTWGYTLVMTFYAFSRLRGRK